MEKWNKYKKVKLIMTRKEYERMSKAMNKSLGQMYKLKNK